MAKERINKELLSLMEDYSLFMEANKEVEMPIKVDTPKINHPQSLYHESLLESDTTFGNTSLCCEVRDNNTLNYSIEILTDRIKSRVLSRLDEGNGTHRNNLPDIPLSEQIVTTPHFHKYDSNGRFYAYKTSSLDVEGNNVLPIEKGFSLFCLEQNIRSKEGTPISIEVKENGSLPFEGDDDPLNGVMF